MVSSVSVELDFLNKRCLPGKKERKKAETLLL